MSDPLRRLGPVVRLAPAKLNLTLAVMGRRADGFHALHSVMVLLALADRLSVAVAPGRRDTLHVTGYPAGPLADNLVLRAIAATRAALGTGRPGGPRAVPALALRLEKRIPVAAGLAGGSSDGAAAIDAALEAWGAELGPEDRLRVALALGSDVPFFLAGGAALVEGRGERVTPLPPVRGEPPGVLLVTPPVAVPTQPVFAAFDGGARPPDDHGVATRLTSEHIAAEMRAGLSGSALVARAGVLAVANDLLVAAGEVAPGLPTFRRALARLLGHPVGQSGSGPTCWALYPSLDAAHEAAASVRDAAAAGRLPALGDGAPFVAATTIQAGGGTDA